MIKIILTNEGGITIESDSPREVLSTIQKLYHAELFKAKEVKVATVKGEKKCKICENQITGHHKTKFCSERCRTIAKKVQDREYARRPDVRRKQREYARRYNAKKRAQAQGLAHDPEKMQQMLENMGAGIEIKHI